MWIIKCCLEVLPDSAIARGVSSFNVDGAPPNRTNRTDTDSLLSSFPPQWAFLRGCRLNINLSTRIKMCEGPDISPESTGD